MKALYLIGGSGFIGKNICRMFHDKYRITVFDQWIDVNFFDKYSDIETYTINLITEKIPESFRTPDFIINLASIVTAERDLSLFDTMINSNLRVLLNLYDRFGGNEGLQLFVQFGSSEEYGSQTSPFTEDMREIPNSPYALVKQLTVNTAFMLCRNYGFPVTVVRPGNLFGQGQPATKFIPYIAQQLLSNKEIKVSPCEQKRDFIYVDDFVWCVGKLLEHSDTCIGEIVNISSGYSVSLKEIIEYMRTITHSHSRIHYGALPYRENEIMDLCCSISKWEAITGERLCFSLQERLRQYIESISI